MKRWMALPAGIVIALGAAWALLSGPRPSSPGVAAPRATTSSPQVGAEIDAASRARLEEILRDADEGTRR